MTDDAPDHAAPLHPMLRWIGLTVLVMAIGSIVVLYLNYVRPARQFAIEKQRVYADFDQLRAESPPDDLTETEWSNAIDWLRTAHANIAFSFDNTDLDAMRDYTRQLEARLADPAITSRQTAIWAWDAMDTLHPRGPAYLEQWRPEFERSFAEADD